MDDLLFRASDWSLACDNALLNKLQEMSDNMVRRAETVNSECDSLMNDVDNLRSKITNVTNDFLVLANTNFVENTVEEFQEFDVGLQSSTEQPLPTKAEKEAMLLEKMKEAIQIGLRSQQENEAKKLKKAEKLCNNSVESRNGLNLGYIIGSPKFFSSKYCGLKTGTSKAPQTSTSYASTEASHSGLEGSTHQFHIPSSDIPSFSQPDFVYQTPTARPSSVTSDSLFTSPVQAPGIPSLSSTPNTDASYSPAPFSKSHQNSEAKYSPTPFSYIPVPVRPPSTPSSSPVSSQADSFSDTDLTQRFTLPNELSTPESPARAVPAEVSVVKPEPSPSMPQATRGPTPNVDDAEKQEFPENEEQETEVGPKSPPVKAQPVHKFMNASVLSQLQSRIAAGPKPPIRRSSSVSEVPPEEDKPDTQRVMEVPEDTVFEVVAANSVQNNLSVPSDSVAPSKVPAPQIKVQVLPSVPAAATKEPKESAKKASSSSKQVSQLKSEPKLSEAKLPVKKSIFDSDSDDEDDFLFSTKPKKSLSTPKASIFSASTTSPKKDIFGRTAVLDASSDDSDADSGLFPAAAPVSRGKDRSIFDDLLESPAPVAPTFVQNVPQQVVTNIPKPPDDSGIMSENQLDQDRAKPAAVLAPAPSSLPTTESKEVDYIPDKIPVEEVLTLDEPQPHLAESASATTVVVQQSQSVTTTTTSTDSIDTARRSPDVTGVSEVTTITETTTVIEEIFTVPEPITVLRIDTPVEPPQVPKAPSRKLEHSAHIPNAPESEEEDLFKDASIAPKKPPEHSVSPVVKLTQPSVDVKLSHPSLTTVPATTKARPVVKKSIFDSSDSDDDLFSTKAPKSRVIINTAGSSLFAPISKDVKIAPPAESKPQKVSVQPPVSEPLILKVEPLSEPVAVAAAPKLPKPESEPTPTIVAPSLEVKTVQVKKPQASTAPTEIKSKSLFDSTDSESDDLFSTKPKSKKATPKSIASTASSKSAASTVSLPKPQSSAKPKKTSKLFDDSDDDDDDDLFTSKSSKLGSAKSSLSALPIASTSTSNTSIPEPTVVPSPAKVKPEFQPANTEILPKEPRELETEPKANVKEKFASVSKNLESLFGAKPKLPGQPQLSHVFSQKPSEDSPAVLVPPMSTSDFQSKSVSFEDQPDSSRLLQCVTKNRPKLSKQRRPPTKGLQKQSAKPESVPEESPAEPEPEPDSNPSAKQKQALQAPDIPEPKVIQVPEVERSLEVQSPPLPPPVPSQTESSSDDDDDEDSLFPRNRVYYD